MSEGVAPRGKSSPLELLQDWSAQLQHNEAQLQRKVKTTLRRQAYRKEKARKPALHIPASPDGSSPAGRAGVDGENTVRNETPSATKGSAPGDLAASLTLQMDSPDHQTFVFGTGGVSPLKNSSGSKMFGRPLQYPGQAHDPLASPAHIRGALFPDPVDSNQEGRTASPQPSLHRLPTSPVRLPGVQLAGQPGMHSPPAEALHRAPHWPSGSPARVLSPSAAQQSAASGRQQQEQQQQRELQGLQRTPPASPGQRTPSAKQPSRRQSPASSPSRLPSTAASAQLHHSPDRRRARHSPALQMAQQQQQPWAGSPGGPQAVSPSRRPQLQQLLPLGLAPSPPQEARRPSTSATPLSKLVQEASPARLARRQSPAGAAIDEDFRIKALSGPRQERPRVAFLGALGVERAVEAPREGAGGATDGSDEDVFFSAAPSRTTSQAMAFASALASGRSSPAAVDSNTSVLQRLQQTACSLAAAVGLAEEAGVVADPAEGPGPSAGRAPCGGDAILGQQTAEEEDDYDDLDALLLGKPPSPAKSHGRNPSRVGDATLPPASPPAAGPAAVQAAVGATEGGDSQQPASGRRSPTNLFGLLARAPPSPGKAEGPPSGAPSPLRQRLLSALGWGGGRAEQQDSDGEEEEGAQPAPSAARPQHGSSGLGGEGEGEEAAPQYSLPSNPFEMLGLDESSGGAGGASSLADWGGQAEVQSLELAGAAAMPARLGSPSPARRRGLFVEIADPSEAALPAARLTALASAPAHSRGMRCQSPAGLEVLQASVASSCGAVSAGPEGAPWEGGPGPSISTPTRLQISRDNPLFVAFGSTIAPVAEPPEADAALRADLPAAHLLLGGGVGPGGPQVAASPAHQLSSSPGRRGLRSPGRGWQLGEGSQEPGSTGGFAAGRRPSSPLEAVPEQEQEGMSSPEAPPRPRRRSSEAAMTESASFAVLEEQAEAWAQAHRPGWSTLLFQLPSTIDIDDADVEKMLQPQDPIAALEETMEAEGISTKRSPKAAGVARPRHARGIAAGLEEGGWAPGGDGLEPQDVGIEAAGASVAPMAAAAATAAEQAEGPLEETMLLRTRQRQQRRQLPSARQAWAAAAAVAAAEGGGDGGPGLHSRSPRAERAAAAGGGRARPCSLDMPREEGLERVQPTPPLFSPSRGHLAADPQQQQWGQAQQRAPLWEAPGVFGLPNPSRAPSPGHRAAARRRLPVPLGGGGLAGAAGGAALSELWGASEEQIQQPQQQQEGEVLDGDGLHMGRSISLRLHQQGSSQGEAVASTQTSCPIPQEGPHPAAGPLHGTASGLAPPPISPSAAAAASPSTAGSPIRRRSAAQQQQRDQQQQERGWAWEQPPPARRQQRQRGAAGSVWREDEKGLPETMSAGPATSPAAAFRRGLAPLQVASDQATEAPLSSSPQRAPSRAHTPAGSPVPALQQPPRRHTAAGTPAPAPSQAAASLPSPAAAAGAALGGLTSPKELPSSRACSPSPAATHVPAPVSAQSSPDVGRGPRVQAGGKRYSPESMQYQERLKHQGEVISSLYLRRQLSGPQDQQGSGKERASLWRSSAAGPGQETPQGPPSHPPPATELAPPQQQEQWGRPGSGPSLRDSTSFQTAQPGGPRDSMSFYTAHATPPRLRRPQHQPQQLGPAALAAGAAGTGPASSPSPVSRLRMFAPAADQPSALRAFENEEEGAGAGLTALQHSTPQSTMPSLDEVSAAQQEGAATPGATPQMTPITAINRLRADLARGGEGAWEGQQQQMQSILSRLETRVRETRTKAKTEAERRVTLEQQVYQLESRLRTLSEEADQAATLKWELTSTQHQLETLREENLKLQREREEWEAQLAAERERERAQPQPPHTGPFRPSWQQQPQQQHRGAALGRSYPQPAPAVRAAGAAAGPFGAAAGSLGAAGAHQSRGDGLAAQPYPAAVAAAAAVAAGDPDAAAAADAMASSILVQDLRFTPPSPPAPAAAAMAVPGGYARPGIAEAPALSFPGHSGLRTRLAPLAVPHAQDAGRAVYQDLSGPDPQYLQYQQQHQQQHLGYAGQPLADYAGGRGSNGSDYSDPATVPWQRMPEAHQQGLWEQQQWGPTTRGGGWDAPPSAKHPSKPNQFARQDHPPRGSTWDPCSTPQARDLNNLLRVAGDSSMFRPLYTGAQQMDRPLGQGRYGTL